MNPLKLLSCILMLFLLFSCNRDDDNLETEICTPNIPQFYNLNVDSYWIYQWYEVNTMGNETIYNRVDTVRNFKDTIINDLQYVIQRGTYFTPNVRDQLLRDSLGNLVTVQGDILFSSTNFTDVLRFDTIGPASSPFLVASFQMESEDLTDITTEAGTFSCLNYQGNHTNFNGTWDTRKTNNYFSEGIGEIESATFYASSPITLVRRLKEYELK